MATLVFWRRIQVVLRQFDSVQVEVDRDIWLSVTYFSW